MHVLAQQSAPGRGVKPGDGVLLELPQSRVVGVCRQQCRGVDVPPHVIGKMLDFSNA